MPFQNRVTLPGSDRVPVPDSREVSPAPEGERVRITVILRRRGEAPVTSQGHVRERVTSGEFARKFGADSSDIQVVEEFARHAQLTIVERSEAKRRVVVEGTLEALTKAFGAKLACYQVDTQGPVFRARTGSLTVPEELHGVVIAVLGLDSRQVAKAHFRKRTATRVSTSYTPPQVAALYNFPTGVNGTGQTVGIVELGGGYSTTDLQTYFSGLGLNTPSVTAVSVDGGTNSPGSQADGEVMLDIEVIGAIANGAKIAVYFAPNTDQGFIDAITDAVHDTTNKPSVISISWGGPEDSWTPQSRTALDAALQDAAALGVTVTVASGDNGSTDGVGDGKLHVDFPASSAYALACGGTTLNGSGTTISSEVVWNETGNNEGATGGGVSTVFSVPSYQLTAHVPVQPETNFAGRGIPDVAGNADPATGYQVRVDGQNQVIGGTSAVAPLWAALLALVNQQLGSPVGYVNAKLYSAAMAGLRDITTGNNDDGGLGYYSASTGWDPCTGLGTPNGAALLSLLTNSTSAGA